MSRTTTKITKTNAVFLATVLVAGIIALSYPSYMVGAQAQEYGMDQRYSNYELYPEPEYGQDNQYNSYEPQYGQDYGMDSYDKKPYGKDNSYDKSSVSVKKIKCNNINVFLNGDVNVNPISDEIGALAASAQAEDEGANGAYSGNDGRSYGHDSNSGFICKITNNNDGRSTATPEEPGEEPPTDPDCDAGVACIFGNLNPTQLAIFYTAIGITADATVDELCIALGDTTAAELRADLEAQVTPQLATFIINCLIRAGFDNLGEVQLI